MPGQVPRRQPYLKAKSGALNTCKHFVNAAISPAYHYNWVVAKNFLISGGLSLGAGVSYFNDEGETGTEFLTQSSLTIALGYNSDTFYGGLYTKGIVSSHSTDTNVVMDDAISYGTLFLGYRFDPPKIVKQKTEEVKEKIKI